MGFIKQLVDARIALPFCLEGLRGDTVAVEGYRPTKFSRDFHLDP